MASGPEIRKTPWRDLSLWGVLGGNALAVLLALLQNWPLSELMWVYWAQSVVIGYVNYKRMMGLKEFSTKGLTSGDEPVPETEEGKTSTARFFAVHYGFFHLGYLIFLWSEAPLTQLSLMDGAVLFLGVAGFYQAHTFSLKYNAERDFRHKKPNLGTLMFYPYLRILPMHLMIIFALGSNNAEAVLLFSGLKTLADAGMHAIEHHLFQSKPKTAAA